MHPCMHTYMYVYIHIHQYRHTYIYTYYVHTYTTPAQPQASPQLSHISNIFLALSLSDQIPKRRGHDLVTFSALHAITFDLALRR